VTAPAGTVLVGTVLGLGPDPVVSVQTDCQTEQTVGLLAAVAAEEEFLTEVAEMLVYFGTVVVVQAVLEAVAAEPGTVVLTVL